MAKVNLTTAQKVTITFFIIGSIWILVADKLLNDMQTYSGWTFVILASVLIYYLVNHFEKQLLKSMKMIKKSNQDIKMLFFKTSHDLRGPVSSIIGLISIARQEVKDKISLDYLEKMEKLGKRMDKTLKSLMSLTSIVDGKIRKEVIDFDQVINEVLTDLQSTPGFEKMKFKIEIDCSNKFYSDPFYIYLILQNLIENSIKYQRPGGTPVSEITLKGIKSYITINVKDNGIGIRQEEKVKIFQMFYRGSQGSQGSGLGLYMTKIAIQRLKGKVNVKSSQSGSEFILSIPSLKN